MNSIWNNQLPVLGLYLVVHGYMSLGVANRHENKHPCGIGIEASQSTQENLCHTAKSIPRRTPTDL